MISTIKDELQTQFPHYWIIISTVNTQGASCNSSGEHYNFTMLTALDSHHFPSATSETLLPGRQLRRGEKGLHLIVSGRALALTTTTKRGGKFVIINLYQFTAANPAEQKEVWDIFAAWVLKHPNDQIILIGDFKSATVGERTGYSLPLSDNKADDSLHDFCQDTGGDLVSSKCHTWRRWKQNASLDNAVTWNHHLSQPQVSPFEAKHKLNDHRVLSFALPAEDLVTTFKVPKQNFDIPTDRYQRNLLQWHKNVQQTISPFASNDGQEETCESLLNKMREEQDHAQ